MFFFETRYGGIHQDCNTQPGELAASQSPKPRPHHFLLGKGKKRTDHGWNLWRNTLMDEPLRHGSRHQVGTSQYDQVPFVSETVQHESLFVFGVAEAVKADGHTLVDV